MNCSISFRKFFFTNRLCLPLKTLFYISTVSMLCHKAGFYCQETQCKAGVVRNDLCPFHCEAVVQWPASMVMGCFLALSRKCAGTVSVSVSTPIPASHGTVLSGIEKNQLAHQVQSDSFINLRVWINCIIRLLPRGATGWPLKTGARVGGFPLGWEP